MKNTGHIFLLLICGVFSRVGLSQEVAKAPEKKNIDQVATIQEFKETQFLQLDSLTFPPELKSIEEELKQNIVDVILSSKTHTPIFAKQREDGYSASYTKFYGLKVTLNPMPTEANFYEMRLFYYNWTTNKYDKELVRKISKFNVLNDTRFAIFELLNGKDYVRNNYDKLQKQNYSQIQILRKNVEEAEARVKKSKVKKRIEDTPVVEEEEDEVTKKKNKLLRKEREKEKNPEYAIVPLEESEEGASKKVKSFDNDTDLNNKNNNKKNKLNNGLGPNESLNGKSPNKDSSKDKSDRAELASKKENNSSELNGDNSLALSDFNIIPGLSTPKKSSIYAFVTFFNEYNESVGPLKVSTNLRYLGFSGRYILEEVTKKPRGLQLSLKFGLPLFKDDYKFPVYKAIGVEVYRKKIINNFMILAGVEYSPVNNVNLPGPGLDLQVFENDFLWGKIGLGYEGYYLNKLHSLKLDYSKSTLLSSSQNAKLSGTRMGVTAQAQIYKMLGAEINFSQTKVIGDFTIDAKTFQFSVSYQF
jgi:hypothetical protein